jgi:hypothetical protein
VTPERELPEPVRAALCALDVGPPPGDLADRAYRRAMAEGRPLSLLERFVLAGRRAVLAGAVAATAVWCAVWIAGAEPDPSAEVTLVPDPRELALSVWAGEELGR